MLIVCAGLFVGGALVALAALFCPQEEAEESANGYFLIIGAGISFLSAVIAIITGVILACKLAFESSVFAGIFALVTLPAIVIFYIVIEKLRNFKRADKVVQPEKKKN